MILWGLCLCLVLLVMELSVLAAAGNWFAVSVTLVAVGGVVLATSVMLLPRGRPRRRFR